LSTTLVPEGIAVRDGYDFIDSDSAAFGWMPYARLVPGRRPGGGHQRDRRPHRRQCYDRRVTDGLADLRLRPVLA
jgi:hypothetical protein